MVKMYQKRILNNDIYTEKQKFVSLSLKKITTISSILHTFFSWVYMYIYTIL